VPNAALKKARGFQGRDRTACARKRRRVQLWIEAGPLPARETSSVPTTKAGVLSGCAASRAEVFGAANYELRAHTAKIRRVFATTADLLG